MGPSQWLIQDVQISLSLSVSLIMFSSSILTSPDTVYALL